MDSPSSLPEFITTMVEGVLPPLDFGLVAADTAATTSLLPARVFRWHWLQLREQVFVGPGPSELIQLGCVL